MILSSDILLNILEYAGSHIVLGVRDEDIINRIRIYDPSFGLDEWNRRVDSKKSLVSMIKSLPLYQVYNYIVENDIVILSTVEDTISLRCKDRSTGSSSTHT